MHKINRAVHIDFHTMPGIDDFGADFSTAQIAQILSDAHVDYINMCARCNIGFSYYPTKIGTPYPTMKGDLLGDIIEECHKRGIGVTAYLNGGINHQILIDNPEFLSINRDGTVYKSDRVNDNYFRTPCFNTGYRQYLLDEIEEILQKEPDGIFCDCLKPKSCYCPSCIKKMHEKNIDINDDEQVLAFALDTLREVFCDIRAVVPKEKRLIFNGHPCDDMYWHQSHVEVECLSTDPIWGYDFLPAIAPYYRHFGEDLLYMNGRFVRSWGDFGGVKTKAAIENDVYDALLYGYVPSIGDHLHPRYGLDKELYDNVTDIYEYIASLEPWTDNTKPVVEAAILRNKITHKNIYNHVTDADKGAARMLSELKISYDIVNEDMDFGKYKLLVLPDNIDITDKLNQKLEGFEGSILSTGKSIREGKVWDYISEFADDSNTHGFYKSGENVRAQYSCGIKMKSAYSTIEYVEPYFNHIYDGLHSYAYVPYREGAGYSALAVKDCRAHICFNIFEAYLKYGAIFHKELVKDVLAILLPNRIIAQGTLPSTARASLMSGEKGDVLHIKVTYPEYRGNIGVIEKHNTLNSGAVVIVDGEYSKAVSLPDKTEIKYVATNGKTELILPQICGHQAFLLTK